MPKARSTLIYADSGDTKTSQAYHLAKRYLRLNPGKRIRLISADGGGYAPFEDSGLIASGQVQVADITATKMAYATCCKLSEGYWYDDQRRLIADQEHLTIERDNIGLYIVEGITAIASLWIDNLSHSETPGYKHSQTFSEDGYSVGVLQEGHYGLMQSEMYRLFVRQFEALPVDRLIVTARVGRGEDKRTGEIVYGPKGAGNAQTAEMTSWFGDSFHLSTEVLTNPQGAQQLMKVAWFANHPDKLSNLIYRAKVRILPELVPDLYALFPQGYMPLGYKFGLDVLYDRLDQITAKYVASVATQPTEKAGAAA